LPFFFFLYAPHDPDFSLESVVGSLFFGFVIKINFVQRRSFCLLFSLTIRLSFFLLLLFFFLTSLATSSANDHFRCLPPLPISPCFVGPRSRKHRPGSDRFYFFPSLLLLSSWLGIARAPHVLLLFPFPAIRIRAPAPVELPFFRISKGRGLRHAGDCSLCEDFTYSYFFPSFIALWYRIPLWYRPGKGFIVVPSPGLARL